jgi:hypothetical protein
LNDLTFQARSAQNWMNGLHRGGVEMRIATAFRVDIAAEEAIPVEVEFELRRGVRWVGGRGLMAGPGVWRV